MGTYLYILTFVSSAALIIARKCKVVLATVLMLLMLPVTSYRTAGSTNSEYKLKAAFIYNFTQYFDWDIAGGEFIIGVVGSSPISDQLEEIARLKTVKDKKIVIKQMDSDIGACHILFVSGSSTMSLSAILEKTQKGCLVVSEKNGYGARGAAINFIVVDNKLRFEANLKAIGAAGLRASSQLLKLAIIVG